MKWIGQHIWSFISRFRNDVYLEAVDTSTETDMLVVDSAGKVTKRAIDAITVDVSDFMTNGVDNRVLTATGTDAINAEANLTFTGSLATITGGTKMISDAPLLMHQSGNEADFANIGLGTHGQLTITTTDAAASGADVTIDADGEIVLDAHTAEDIFFKEGGSERFKFHLDSTPTMEVTGAFDINSTGLIKTRGVGVEIENASDSGVAALLIDNDDADEVALLFNALNTTASIISCGALALTTGSLLYLQHVSIHTAGHDTNLCVIQYTNVGVLASGQTQNIVGLNIPMTDMATNDASSIKTLTGIDLKCSYANAQGTTSATGIKIVTTGADTNTGLDMTTTDGGTDIILRSSADTGDTFSIATTTHGATTLTTVDDDATAAHFEIAADGDIILDSAGDIEINTDGGSVNFKDASAQLALISATGLDFTDNLNAGIIFEGATDDAHKTTLGVVDPTGTRAVNLPDETGTVALTDDAAGAQFFHIRYAGSTKNFTSTTRYYTGHNYQTLTSNYDESPTTIDHLDLAAAVYIAPRDGRISNIKIQGSNVTGTGFDDPFKFYLYKGPMVSDTTTASLTLMGSTTSIEPPTVNETWLHTEDWTSGMTFSEDDMIFIFFKKDSNSGAQSIAFNMNINGYLKV